MSKYTDITFSLDEGRGDPLSVAPVDAAAWEDAAHFGADLRMSEDKPALPVEFFFSTNQAYAAKFQEESEINLPTDEQLERFMRIAGASGIIPSTCSEETDKLMKLVLFTLLNKDRILGYR